MTTRSLRLCSTFQRNFRPEVNEEWTFSREPIVVSEDFYEIPSEIDSGEETDPEDHETRIQSSWHHRALLSDEDRLLYTDYLQEYIESLEANILAAYEEEDEDEDEEENVIF